MGFIARLVGLETPLDAKAAGPGAWPPEAGGIDSYDPGQVVLPAPFEAYTSTGGIPVMDPGSPIEWWIGNERSKIDHFWGNQPNLRKVVDFIARAVAGVPFQVFARVSDTERRRITDGPLAAVLGLPAKDTSPFRFWRSVVADGLLYDRWAVLVVANDRGTDLVQIPSWRLAIDVDALRRVSGIRYWQGDKNDHEPWVDLDPDEVIYDFGYAPHSAGKSPVQTLGDVLDEAAEAVRYRRQVWEHGARMPGYIKRPADAPPWTREQRERFKTQLGGAFGRRGQESGGLPLLEDGMGVETVASFKPQDTADLEGRRLTAIEVAAAYHIAPELVGAQQGNYSNVKEYRQMLYRDSLGPYIQAIEGVLNAQLLPRLLGDGGSVYVEANIEAKLRGSFEEQAQIMSTAVGAPWTTRNEARARQNMPPIPGGDEIVTPLNVIAGGQASPRDSAPGKGRGRADNPPAGVLRTSDDAIAGPDDPLTPLVRPIGALKASVTETQRAKVAEVLDAFFARQGAVVLSRIGSGRDWWDGDRWDAELADDLTGVMHTLAGIMGKAEADRLGYPDDFDVDTATAFIRAVAERYATGINATTKAAIDATLTDETDETPADVFTAARDNRAPGAAVILGTFVAGFATVEAAKQVARGQGVEPVKTWVTGRNPRPEHAALDGEERPIEETFSNGGMWPGDDGECGCNCSVVITF